MIYILNEGNKDLEGKRFGLTPNIKKYLYNVLEQYKGKKNITGYKRLINILNMNEYDGGIEYKELKRLKNWFDSNINNKKTDEYNIIGGDVMKNWVEYTLNTATGNIKNWKTNLKNAGVQNAFIKSHEKNI